MKNKPWYPVVYMFIVTAFFSFIVIGFAEFTEERVKSNERIAFERSVLEVFDLAENVKAGQIHEKFVENIRQPREGSAGAYIYEEDGRLEGYAVEIAGKGYWAPIRGIVGVSAETMKITGISFFEQNETPGLGAEILSESFRRQFEGIALSAGRKPVGIEPVGTKLGENDVHAISGATQTCTRLGKFLNEDISRWLDKMEGKADGK